MTAYTDTIPLATAKTYLKIDASQVETDDEITAMINSACAYIESRTGWIMKDKQQVYFGNPYATVYDYPITSILPDGSYERVTSVIVPTVDGKVKLDTGITAVSELPVALLDCALQIINFWFYNKETDGADNSIPNFVVQNIDTYRRFI